MDVVGIDQRSPFVIVGKHCSTIAIASHRLGREKRSGGDVTKSTGFAVSNTASETLGGVFKHIKPKPVGNGTDHLEVGGKAKQINGNDGSRLQLTRFDRAFDLGYQIANVDVEGVGIHIDKDWCGALHGDDLCRSEESETRDKDCIPRLHPPGFQSQQQGIGATIAGNAVFHSDILGESGLHLFHLGTHDVCTGGSHFQHGLVHLALQGLILFL